jgi:hypothetical protein
VGSGDGADGVFHDLDQAFDFGDCELADDYSRPTLEMLVTLPSGGAASLAASAAWPQLVLIAGCATSLPLKPLRSPDQNDPLFENRSNGDSGVEAAV